MQIGKYKILGLLGTGGMSRVYLARLPVVSKMVALKLLRPSDHMLHLLGRTAVEELFLTEAKTLAAIRHPHIATLLDFDHDSNGRPFFIMEYQCMNLGLLIGESYVMESPARILPPDRAAHIADQIMSGLDRLHHSGIYHRDIKPFNILLSENDHATLIDFGLSRLRGETRAMPDTMKVGTPYYTPPEQEADPDRIDHRADLYAAGVLIWRMLTGFLPPESGIRPKPGKLNPVLGDFWDEFLLKATEKKPDQRFPNCDAMRDALHTAAENWRNHLDNLCTIFPEQTGDDEQNIIGGTRLRSDPVKVRKNAARSYFGLNEVWRPIDSRVPRFSRGEDPFLVHDRTHALTWQQSGGRYPVDYSQAVDYVQVLNETRHGGINNWRLPTVDELISLIRPYSDLGDYCTPSLFDSKRQRLWSADRKSFTAAWFVDTGLGYVADMEFTCRCHVRAVSDGSFFSEP